ncbi:MAG: hypothetical protein ACRDOH_16795 [Streptosporangiaceae bacterium]
MASVSAVTPAARAARTAPVTDSAPSETTIGCPARRPARKHRPA